jgi:hypothetical protein
VKGSLSDLKSLGDFKRYGVESKAFPRLKKLFLFGKTYSTFSTKD